MRADIHDGPEQTLPSEAGYSNARPDRQDRRNLLHRTAGPYRWVKSADFTPSERGPLCTPLADEERTFAGFGSVPIADPQPFQSASEIEPVPRVAFRGNS